MISNLYKKKVEEGHSVFEQGKPSFYTFDPTMNGEKAYEISDGDTVATYTEDKKFLSLLCD